MICEDIKRIKRYCSNYELIENYQEAVSSPERWDCHHRKETEEGLSVDDLINLNLYWHRPPEELIFLMRKQHLSLHHIGNKHGIGNKSMTGKRHTEESKRKMSESSSGGNNPWYGKHLSKETRKKISDAHKGKKHTEESKRKMSISRRGDKNPRYKSFDMAFVWDLRYNQGLSYKEIAETISIIYNIKIHGSSICKRLLKI